jgi:hypothetical protein
MKIAKGFAKNYFTLAAIQASSAEVTLSSSQARVASLSLIYHDKDDKEEEDPPPDGILLLALPVAKQCNCIFNQKCRLTLKRTKFRGQPQCNCRHLSHRKTGISPPSFPL